MIAHLLSTVPYHDVQLQPLQLPPRPKSQGYLRAPREAQTYVPDHAASLVTGSSKSGDLVIDGDGGLSPA